MPLPTTCRPSLAIYNDAVLCTTAVYDEELRTPEARWQWFAAKAAQRWPLLVAAFASEGPFRPWPGYRLSVERRLIAAASALHSSRR